MHTAFTLLQDPRKNKGTAFSQAERDQFGLNGLLPNVIETLDTQVNRVLGQIDQFEKPINKYIYLMQLLESNETLFFKTVMSDPAKYLPLVYTPTVGEACETFGHIMRSPRGIYISIKDQHRIREILQNWYDADVRFAVVTDGERILGLGDLGVCGMGIPIGKLCLYTTCAGVPPEYTLPITLDVGTNNAKFLDDPLYPGLRQKRVGGEEYDAFVKEFVAAIQDVFPKICIQWEDFAGAEAIEILHKYKDKICSYNDDIQGTAAVATGGLLAACHYSQKALSEQTFLFLGAGAAATGIANLLALKMQLNGLTKAEAYSRFYMFDVNGLLVRSRTDIQDFQEPFVHDMEPNRNFAEAILQIKPTAIIGVSTVGGAFNEQVVTNMAQLNERPIIFPYSNPTSHAECTAEQAITWSKGTCIFASGSPFGPVTYQGKTFTPGQGNNVYIFPAMGLAIFATEAKRVTDKMFIIAAEALASQVTKAHFEKGLIYPPIQDILEVSVNIAIRIAGEIFDSELAGIERPANLEQFIRDKMYQPVYR
jgi:malate dehydrogenase (oxaloacetate-decarboxylating)(NADP+)